MRRSPRLIRGNHDRAGTPGSLPRTPHKSGPVLDDLIARIESEFHLGLRVRDKSWTPKKSDGAPLADKVYGQIKHLFYSSQPTLEATIKDFRTIVRRVDKSQQLSCLSKLLAKSKTRSPPSRIGTPASRPQKMLTDSALPPHSSATPHLFSHYSVRRVNPESDSYQTAIEDSGSPTDVEDDGDDAFFTPPSPTLAAMKRRDHAEPAQLVPSPIPRKRSMNDSSSTTSPKFSKTEVGRIDLYPKLRDPDTSEFKIPAKNLERSFQATDNTTSLNTSFDTERSMWSQRTLFDSTDSVATSFGTDSASDKRIDHIFANKPAVGHAFEQSSGNDLEIIKNGNLSPDKIRKRYDSQKWTGEPMWSYGSESEVDYYAAIESSKTTETQLEPTAQVFLHRRTQDPASTSDSTMEALYQADDAAKQDLGMSRPTSFAASKHSFKDPPTAFEEGHKLPRSVASRKARDVEHDPISPLKLPHWLQNLPKEDLLGGNLATSDFENIPYFLAFICRRLSLRMDRPLKDILNKLDTRKPLGDRNTFWNLLKEYEPLPHKESNAIWANSGKSFEGYTFQGTLKLENPSSKTFQALFKLDDLAIQKERSCLLQRMFGSDRFLYLVLDDDKPNWCNEQDMSRMREQLTAWLMNEHNFLGRRWHAFHAKRTKRKTTRDDASIIRVVLFATEGLHIDPISIDTMINTFFNFSANGKQLFPKAFARLDLALTKTIPTVVFKPSQIEYIRDVVADTKSEATEFNDPDLDWSQHKYPEGEVMNDGAAQISVGAALSIWEIVKKRDGIDGPLPSAFQARIGAAKGMWMISAEPHTTEPKHLAVWIKITDSQLKAKPASEDEADDKPYNPHRLTFNYYKHSRVHGSSGLHTSFNQILVDRKVPLDAIVQTVQSGLETDRAELLNVLQNPSHLHNWVSKQGSSVAESGLIPWKASLPIAAAEKLKLLLSSGLSPTDSPFLAKELRKFIRKYHMYIEENIRAPLGKSTSLIGLPDPFRVLEPGEVHINFSEPFVDKYDGKTYRTLAGEQVLVARQPACRRSDMQKLRAVSHPQLSHLVDVIVFSTQGQHPTAASLQGGDYDGDTFWTCWESTIVRYFVNAPPPTSSPKPEDLGIKQEERCVDQVMDKSGLSPVHGFLREAFKFVMQDSLLGKATNFGDGLAYKTRCIHSESINILRDLHDLLVDAAKQGYTFTSDDFWKLMKRHGLVRPPIPAFKQAMDKNKEKRVKEDEDDLVSHKKIPYDESNINDHLYFDIMVRHHMETRIEIAKLLPNWNVPDSDPDLRYPYLYQKNIKDPIIAHELDLLVRQIKGLEEEWSRHMHPGVKHEGDSYANLVIKLYEQFSAIQPSPQNAAHPSIARLTSKPLSPYQLTDWEMIRASTLFTLCPKRHTFVWTMAGRLLTKLKVMSDPNAYTQIAPIHGLQKPKTSKKKAVEQDDDVVEQESSEDEFDDALSMWDSADIWDVDR